MRKVEGKSPDEGPEYRSGLLANHFVYILINKPSVERNREGGYSWRCEGKL